MRVPRALRVLYAPTATFDEVIQSGRGFGDVFWFLAIEFALIYPLSVTSSVMRIPGSPSAGIINLWSLFVHHALVSAVVTFCVGIVLYYALRLKGPRTLDIYVTGSLVAYLWAPHVLLVGISAFLAGFGVQHALLANTPFEGLPINGTFILKGILNFAPSAALGVFAVKTAWRAEPPKDADPVPAPAASAWRIRTAIIASALILVAGFVQTGRLIANDWQRVRPLLAGDTLPAFALSELSGTTMNSRELQGKVVLMDFWATWCGPCVASMPHMQALHNDLSEHGFKLLSVNTEPGELDKVRDFMRTHRLTFPVYVDRGAALQRRFQVQTYPTAFLIDRDGVVREVHIGATSMLSLRQEIEELLRM